MGLPAPYIASKESPPEFTPRALLTGALAGIIFGSANAYLGLRVGLTISTSIPIAIIAVALFQLRRGRSTLEVNMVQTIGSASSSLASGLIFTVPALFLWGVPPGVAAMALWGCAGGILGTLFMILLRRPLIVEAHETLPYPEGTACAEVIKAAEAGGVGARPVFVGIGIGALYKFCQGFAMLWASKLWVTLPILPKAMLGFETSPALLGVGYILNYRIAAVVVSGGLLAWLVLIPTLAYVGNLATQPIPPVTDLLLSALAPKDIWHHYVRFIGAGAVASAGIITVLRGLPTMIRSFLQGWTALRAGAAARAGCARVDRDLPVSWILAGVGIIILGLAAVPGLLGPLSMGGGRIVAAVAIALFSFLFVTVSSRIVGMVGVSTNPTSGMTIVTLLGTSLVFYWLGWTDDAGRATALIVGAVVAVAASVAGDISQDLKTGFLLGATPRQQQVGELLGVITSCAFIAAAIWMLGQTYTFGSEELPAPQATLMRTVIDGVLTGNLPWALIMLGVGITVFCEVTGIPSLPFAVGVYLPVVALVPIYFGGILRRYVDYRRRRQQTLTDSEPGVLLSSGLIAGEGICGILIAVVAFIRGTGAGWPLPLPAPWDQIVSLAVFVALIGYLLRVARPARRA